MTANTVASRKAKGRRFQQWIADRIGKLLNLPAGKDLDVESRPMSQSGTDIRLSEKAKCLFKFDVEAKNVESINVWKAVEQAQSNQSEGCDWLVFLKKNGKQPIVVMDSNTFFKLMEKIL